MRIQLVRKLADHLDGIDVTAYREGDVFELSVREAELLIAEGWAVPIVDGVYEVRGESAPPELAMAADRGGERRTLEQLRRLRAQMETRLYHEEQRRRAEDRIREELHDARAKAINGGA